jgi:hypothetical protein
LIAELRKRLGLPAGAWSTGARVLALLALAAGEVGAQGGPVFQLQPGMAVADFVSVPEGTASNTAFAVRFATSFPSNRWLNPVVGAVLTPYGSTGTTNRNTDAPTLFAGNVFRVVTSTQTSGWLSFDLPLLVNHAPGAGPSGNLRDYGRDLVLLPTIYLHIGSRAFGDLGRLWSRLDLFGQVEQNLTPNRDRATGARDRLNPVATFGASFTLGSTLPQ